MAIAEYPRFSVGTHSESFLAGATQPNSAIQEIAHPAIIKSFAPCGSPESETADYGREMKARDSEFRAFFQELPAEGKAPAGAPTNRSDGLPTPGWVTQRVDQAARS
jgi:hypothetical protein